MSTLCIKRPQKILYPLFFLFLCYPFSFFTYARLVAKSPTSEFPHDNFWEYLLTEQFDDPNEVLSLHFARHPDTTSETPSDDPRSNAPIGSSVSSPEMRTRDVPESSISKHRILPDSSDSAESQRPEKAVTPNENESSDAHWGSQSLLQKYEWQMLKNIEEALMNPFQGSEISHNPISSPTTSGGSSSAWNLASPQHQPSNKGIHLQIRLPSVETVAMTSSSKKTEQSTKYLYLIKPDRQEPPPYAEPPKRRMSVVVDRRGSMKERVGTTTPPNRRRNREKASPEKNSDSMPNKKGRLSSSILSPAEINERMERVDSCRLEKFQNFKASHGKIPELRGNQALKKYLQAYDFEVGESGFDLFEDKPIRQRLQRREKSEIFDSSIILGSHELESNKKSIILFKEELKSPFPPSKNTETAHLHAQMKKRVAEVTQSIVGFTKLLKIYSEGETSNKEIYRAEELEELWQFMIDVLNYLFNVSYSVKNSNIEELAARLKVHKDFELRAMIEGAKGKVTNLTDSYVKFQLTCDLLGAWLSRKSPDLWDASNVWKHKLSLGFRNFLGDALRDHMHSNIGENIKSISQSYKPTD